MSDYEPEIAEKRSADDLGLESPKPRKQRQAPVSGRRAAQVDEDFCPDEEFDMEEEEEEVSLDEEEEEEKPKPKKRSPPKKPVKKPAQRKNAKKDEDFNPEEEDESEDSKPPQSEDEDAPKKPPTKAKRPPKEKPEKQDKPGAPESNRARINRMKEGFMPFEIPKGTKLNAHIIDVYDGDTITGTFGLWGQKFWASFRLTGLDTAEKKVSKSIMNDLENNEEHIAKYTRIAMAAKEYVKERCYEKVVQVICHGADKYGRTLCDVLIDDTTIQQQIIDKKLAFPYEGDTKNTAMDFVTQLGPDL